MIELPRAALLAKDIANADFFSFGTNDLTQMTFGFSRDDMGKFLTPTSVPGFSPTLRWPSSTSTVSASRCRWVPTWSLQQCAAEGRRLR